MFLGRDFTGGEGELVFGHGVVRKEIEIPIVNDFEEEKVTLDINEVYLTNFQCPSG